MKNYKKRRCIIINNNKIIIFIGPSGSGKTTLSDKFAKLTGAKKIITNTTRKIRNGEKDGVTYNYLTFKKFNKLIEHGQMLEWTQYPNPKITEDWNFYGLSKDTIDNALKSEKLTYVVVDKVGLQKIQKLYPDNNISFFITTKDTNTLKTRLSSRGEDTNTIDFRTKQIADDQKQSSNCDYIIYNENIETAISDILSKIRQ